jgi:hypothetical protein
MTINNRHFERLLRGKFRFAEATHHEVGHKWFELEISDKLTIRTRVSHGSGDIHRKLEKAIAQQLRVRTSFFREMMSCCRDYDDYCSTVLSESVPPQGCKPH